MTRPLSVGTIKAVYNYGTVVQIVVANTRTTQAVYMEHRAFAGLAADYNPLVGRRVRVSRHGDSLTVLS